MSRAAKRGTPSCVLPCPRSGPPQAGRFDSDRAAARLKASKKPKSTGYCARHVRLALMAGGVPLKTWPPVARDYAPVLRKHGFSEVPKSGYAPKKGDVAVMQPYPGGNPAGHICMYDGERWVSDFEQKDQWGSEGYRKQGQAQIFRHGG